jgi:hypothetical protein
LQKFEFLSLKQGQSNTSRQTTTSSVRQQSARARAVPPWRPGRRPALLGWLHCPRPHSPKPRTIPRPPRSPSPLLTPRGRTSARWTVGPFPVGLPVRAARAPPEHCPWPALLSPLSAARAPSHYKGDATRRAPYAPAVHGPSRRRRH